MKAAQTNGVSVAWMFTGEGEEAMRYYEDVIPSFEVKEIIRHTEGDMKGKIAQGFCTLNSLHIVISDSPPVHSFTFTPSTTLMLFLPSSQEVDALAGKLKGEEGKYLMPPGDYGFCKYFAFVTDRFGISWQLRVDATQCE